MAGELEIRTDQFQAFVGTQSADLTRREFELLHLLAEGRGQVLQREEIYQRVWGYQMARGDRSVDVFVRKVRSKLKALSPEWNYIHTHFGIGYRFQPEPSDGDPADAVVPEADRLETGLDTAPAGGEAGTEGEQTVKAHRSTRCERPHETPPPANLGRHRPDGPARGGRAQCRAASGLLRDMLADYPERSELAPTSCCASRRATESRTT